MLNSTEVSNGDECLDEMESTGRLSDVEIQVCNKYSWGGPRLWMLKVQIF